jgi:hypothetical protein
LWGFGALFGSLRLPNTAPQLHCAPACVAAGRTPGTEAAPPAYADVRLRRLYAGAGGLLGGFVRRGTVGGHGFYYAL